MVSFGITFFRITIGLVFAISLAGKLRDISTFIQTITNFQFFPKSFSQPLAYLFLLGELGTLVAMIVGTSLLFWGFMAAMLMFLAFSIALSSVVKRKIETSCNCFGPDEKNVGNGHIIRSLGFMACGLGGLVLVLPGVAVRSLGWIDLLAGVMGVFFVLIWTHIDDILKILSTVNS